MTDEERARELAYYLMGKDSLGSKDEVLEAFTKRIANAFRATVNPVGSARRGRWGMSEVPRHWVNRDNLSHKMWTGTYVEVVMASDHERVMRECVERSNESFEKIKKELGCEPGESILDAIQRLKVSLPF